MIKKILLLLTINFSIYTSVFADEVYEMKEGCEYLFFSDKKIESIKSNNPNIISAQKVATFQSDSNQIIFSAKKAGLADIQIKTAEDVITYPIEIKKNNVKNNKIFMEIDFPGISE